MSISLLSLWTLVAPLDGPDALHQPRPRPRACVPMVEVAPDTSIVHDAKAGADALIRYAAKQRGPSYPPKQLGAGRGRVLARFVVDTAGRVIPGTAVITSETHRDFGTAVCDFLTRAAFETRPVNGRRLTVEVKDVPFDFFTKP